MTPNLTSRSQPKLRPFLQADVCCPSLGLQDLPPSTTPLILVHLLAGWAKWELREQEATSVYPAHT